VHRASLPYREVGRPCAAAYRLVHCGKVNAVAPVPRVLLGASIGPILSTTSCRALRAGSCACGERERLEASKTHVVLAAIERVTEHPAFRPASADLQREAAAVTVEATSVERLRLSARQRPNLT
jgi:hypothetical protein